MYKTKADDMFDFIAYKETGDCLNTQALMRANRTKLHFFKFPANISLDIPTIEKNNSINLPPWKK